MSELETMTNDDIWNKIKLAIAEHDEKTLESCEKIIKSRLSRLERGERAIQAYNQIADIVHNYSCHSAEEAYARITEIVMEYEKEGGK